MTVFILEIFFDDAGNKTVLYPTVLHHGSEVVLVDCDYPGFMYLIDNVLQLQLQ